MRASLRKLLLTGIGVLYVISVPWYRETGGEVTYLLGLPSWVTVAVACYVGVAVLNCGAWLLTDMPEEPDGHAPDDRPERQRGNGGGLP
jgi:hypothetical protein